MAKYTQTKIHRSFERIPIAPGLTKVVRRKEPIPATQRIQTQLYIRTRDNKKHPLPLLTWVAPGQIINTYKEYKRQRKLLDGLEGLLF